MTAPAINQCVYGPASCTKPYKPTINGRQVSLVVTKRGHWNAFHEAVKPKSKTVIIGALLMGITSLPFMAPFIMGANATLVILFGLLKRLSPLFAGVTASLAKYGFFVLTVQVLVRMIGKTLPAKAAAAFGVTQLGTAFIGLMLALIIADTLKPYLEREQR